MAGAAAEGYDVRKVRIIKLWQLEKVKGHVVLTSRKLRFPKKWANNLSLLSMEIEVCETYKIRGVISQRGLQLT